MGAVDMARGRGSAASGRAPPGPGARGRTALSRAARRLLAALAEPASSARPDPSRDGYLIVRGRESGVSLGRGAHPASAAAELLRHDLVSGTDAGGVVISGPGSAHLRRSGSADGAEYQDQHRLRTAAEFRDVHGVARVAVNAAESTLAWLRRRRDRDGAPLIDAAAFEAGERLRRDLTFAGMLPSVTARWNGAVGGGGGYDPGGAADSTIAARQRVRHALDALGGEFGNLLLDLCGFLKGLETIERERSWPSRSGKIVVRLALGQLARHYGLASEVTGPSAGGRLRSWQAGEGAD